MTSKTILITGVTGYIARHIALQALEAGERVIGSTRDLSREAALRDALRANLSDPAKLDNLRLMALDNTDDTGWAEAFDGVEALIHTASPVPVRQPDDPEEVIRPAVDGALRAAKAAYAAGLRRMVMTSSIAAVTSCPIRPGHQAHDEQDWSDLTRPGLSPYLASKTLAERAVWDWQAAEAPEMRVTMINPAVVIGPPVGPEIGASVYILRRLMQGKDAFLPRLGYPLVDVRDVAAMHLRALERPEAEGERFIASNKFYWHGQIARDLSAAFPARHIPTRVMPDWVFRLLARFVKPLRGLVPLLGTREEVDGSKATRVLGIQYRDTDATIRETAQALIDHKLV